MSVLYAARHSRTRTTGALLGGDATLCTSPTSIPTGRVCVIHLGVNPDGQVDQVLQDEARLGDMRPAQQVPPLPFTQFEGRPEHVAVGEGLPHLSATDDRRY